MQKPPINANQIVKRLLLFAFLYLFFIVLSWLPYVRPVIDTFYQTRVERSLIKTSKKYFFSTSKGNRQQIPNKLIIGVLPIDQNQLGAINRFGSPSRMNMDMHQIQLNIREFFVSPFLLLLLLIGFTSVSWKKRGLLLLITAPVLHLLIHLRLRAIINYEMIALEGEAPSGILFILPYMGPWFAFFVVFFLWLIGLQILKLRFKEVLGISQK